MTTVTDERDLRETEMVPKSQLPTEAVARRARSIAHLQAEGIPVFADLFVIETVEQVFSRTAQEVARRALCLAVVAVHADAQDREWTLELLNELDLEPDLSPQERSFLATPDIDQQLVAKFSWRYEAMLPLLWAIGFAPELPRPDHQINVPEVLQPIVKLKFGELEKQARLRPADELLDATDLTLRYNWAVRDNWIKGLPPPSGLDQGVVAERHQALNWLIRDEPWDDVDTAT